MNKKKHFLWMLLLPLALAGCTKDNILTQTFSTGDNTTPASTVEVPTDDEDYVAGTNFVRTISLVWSASSVAVTGDANNIVSVSGTDVTIDNTGTTEKVKYELSGSCSDGSLKIYSNNKQALYLNGLSLTNPDGAAINNQGKKRCFVVVSGANTLADGSSAAYAQTGEEDMKAVFFSEGQLIFSGNGSLSIIANNQQGKAALTSDDYIRLVEDAPALTVTAGSQAGHGIRGKDYIYIGGGTVKASVAAAMKKGFSSDSLVVITGGATTIDVTGGSAYDSEDQDYSGSAGIKADYAFKMTGGMVNITNSGQGGKGIKVGGSSDKGVKIFTSEISGGTLDINVTGSDYTAGDVSAKGIKIGWAIKSSTKAGPGGFNPGGGPGGNPGGGMGGGGTTYSDMTGDLLISGGTVRVSCTANEAIEVKKTLTITGGEVFAYSTADDAINSGSTFTISGGKVCGISTANDGLDSNGNFYIQGGIVYGSGAGGAELGIDTNSEGGFKLYLQGGTVVALGGVESGASNSLQSAYSSWSANKWYGITSGSTSFALKTPSSGGNTMYVYGASKPSVQSGITTSGASFWNGYGYTGF
ncbi:MAG: carbohydrate-binding domain-containing protein [Bacteroidales bacterium]|nr:carbohydrate-binding domain-containing protein [Bacteroidales bacterium]